MDRDKVIEVLEHGLDERRCELNSLQQEAGEHELDENQLSHVNFLLTQITTMAQAISMIKENAKLKEDNSYVASWMDKVHELEKENEALKKYIDKMKKGFIPANVEDGCYCCKLKAENGELRKKNRTMYCIYCGENIHTYVEHNHSVEELKAIIVMAKKHDRECKSNPIVQELTELKAKYEELEKRDCFGCAENCAVVEDRDSYIGKLEDELADLKKEVASEGKEITNCPSCGKEWNIKKYNACECGAVIKDNGASEGLGVLSVQELMWIIEPISNTTKTRDIAEAIHNAIVEAQTKYKKEKGEI